MYVTELFSFETMRTEVVDRRLRLFGPNGPLKGEVRLTMSWAKLPEMPSPDHVLLPTTALALDSAPGIDPPDERPRPTGALAKLRAFTVRHDPVVACRPSL